MTAEKENLTVLSPRQYTTSGGEVFKTKAEMDAYLRGWRAAVNCINAAADNTARNLHMARQATDTGTPDDT